MVVIMIFLYIDDSRINIKWLKYIDEVKLVQKIVNLYRFI